MTTPRTSQKRKLTEKTRPLARAKLLGVKLVEIQAKLTCVQNEMMLVQAHNYHLFTLVFPHRKAALLEVWGAEDADAACHSAHDVARDEGRTYHVLEVDHTEGQAWVVYHWCSPRALVVNAVLISRHLEGPLLHIVLRPNNGDSPGE